MSRIQNVIVLDVNVSGNLISNYNETDNSQLTRAKNNPNDKTIKQKTATKNKLESVQN